MFFVLKLADLANLSGGLLADFDSLAAVCKVFDLLDLNLSDLDSFFFIGKLWCSFSLLFRMGGFFPC